jgi:cysteine desulfurase/selenocysteine lyase
MLKASSAALDRFCELKSGGMSGRDQLLEMHAETKEMLASYLQAPGGASDIAFTGSASDGLNVLARGIDWQTGDQVVSLYGEFPSVLLPWLSLRTRGVTLTAVRAGDDPEAAIESVVTNRTRVICISYVNYWDGLRVDLRRLAAIAQSRGAILVVDVSHALGAMPIPIEYCDVLVSCCYKFMLATHGVGVLYWNRRRLADLGQLSVGWHSVQWPSADERSQSYQLKEGAVRFELGNPPFISLFVLNQALRLLSTVDAADTQQHVIELGSQLRDGLLLRGLTVLTPESPERRGTNMVFASLHSENVMLELAQRNVLVWGGEQRVRFSFHGFNDSSDVDAALAALDGAPSAKDDQNHQSWSSLT